MFQQLRVFVIALVAVVACSSCAVQPETPEEIATPLAPDRKAPQVSTLSASFTINGIEIRPGIPFELSTTGSTIRFDGTVRRALSVRRELSGSETASFLGCLAFLPLCALTGNLSALSGNPDITQTNSVRYEEVHCVGAVTFYAKTDREYLVRLVNEIDNLPVLRVSDVSATPSVQAEENATYEPAELRSMSKNPLMEPRLS